jgi:hypothetical protein
VHLPVVVTVGVPLPVVRRVHGLVERVGRGRAVGDGGERRGRRAVGVLVGGGVVRSVGLQGVAVRQGGRGREGGVAFPLTRLAQGTGRHARRVGRLIVASSAAVAALCSCKRQKEHTYIPRVQKQTQARRFIRINL